MPPRTAAISIAIPVVARAVVAWVETPRQRAVPPRATRPRLPRRKPTERELARGSQTRRRMKPKPPRHPVVLGSSMAGLGAARALSDHFEHVTVVERDALSEAPSLPSRKGVPQGNHGHGLLASGYRILDAYFPGMMDELVAEGASPGDATADFLWYQFGAWKLRTSSDLRGIIVSRPLLEAKVRSRVRALPNVSLLTDHDVEAPRPLGLRRDAGVDHSLRRHLCLGHVRASPRRLHGRDGRHREPDASARATRRRRVRRRRRPVARHPHGRHRRSPTDRSGGLPCVRALAPHLRRLRSRRRSRADVGDPHAPLSCESPAPLRAPRRPRATSSSATRSAASTPSTGRG